MSAKTQKTSTQPHNPSQIRKGDVRQVFKSVSSSKVAGDNGRWPSEECIAGLYGPLERYLAHIFPYWKHDVEEVVQNAVVKFSEKWHIYTPSNPKAWARTIARHEMLNHIKARQRSRKRDQEAYESDVIHKPLVSEPFRYDDLHAMALVMFIDKCAQEENIPQWELAKRKYLEGLTWKEIGNKMEKNPKTIESQLTKNKEKIQKSIRVLCDFYQTTFFPEMVKGLEQVKWQRFRTHIVPYGASPDEDMDVELGERLRIFWEEIGQKLTEVEVSQIYQPWFAVWAQKAATSPLSDKGELNSLGLEVDRSWRRACHLSDVLKQVTRDINNDDINTKPPTPLSDTGDSAMNGTPNNQEMKRSVVEAVFELYFGNAAIDGPSEEERKKARMLLIGLEENRRQAQRQAHQMSAEEGISTLTKRWDEVVQSMSLRVVEVLQTLCAFEAENSTAFADTGTLGGYRLFTGMFSVGGNLRKVEIHVREGAYGLLTIGCCLAPLSEEAPVKLLLKGRIGFAIPHSTNTATLYQQFTIYSDGRDGLVWGRPVPSPLSQHNLSLAQVTTTWTFGD